MPITRIRVPISSRLDFRGARAYINNEGAGAASQKHCYNHTCGGMARFPGCAITHFIIEPLNESSQFISPFRPLFLSLSLSFYFIPSSPHCSKPSPPTFAKSVFAHNIIGYGKYPQAGEGRQPTRQVVMVYILFHPVILANDKDGSSNKSRGRRMLDTENVTRISFLRGYTRA